MIPYFFATDRVRYSQWLSIHSHDLTRIQSKWPSLRSHLESGKFVVNRTQNKFSSVPPDQALEQSLYKDVKCAGGLVGQTTNDNARSRWFLNSHIKATITEEVNRMRGRADSKTNIDFRHHTDNKADQKQSLVWPKQIMDHITEHHLEPFGKVQTQREVQIPTYVDRSADPLYNFVTGDELSIKDSESV